MHTLMALGALLMLPPAEVRQDELDLDLARATATGERAFAFDLFHALCDREGNLFVSPFSVHLAIAMAREGARGKTAAEMDEVLHLIDEGRAKGHSALALALQPSQLETVFQGGSGQVDAFTLRTASRVWGQDGLEFLEPFISVLEDDFSAPLERVDFRDATAARERINGWVAERTAQRVRDIIPADQPEPDTLIALVNATHFKAAWKSDFAESSTALGPFTTAEGTTVQVPMMRQTARFAYTADDQAQILQLPFLGDETAMVIMMPRHADGFAALERQLTMARVDEWIGRLALHRIALELPRFEARSSFDLAETLGALGMATAFDRHCADFSGMTAEEPLFLGAALHEAVVAVDEEGTEAAAATVFTGRLGGRAPREEAIPFAIDRPFVFLIRHVRTGCVLFIGRCADPAPS